MIARISVKRISTISLIIILVIIASIALFVSLRAHHFWRQVSQAKVTYNDKVLNRSSVYRSPTNGDLLIRLEDLPYERSLFVVKVGDGKVGLPNEDQFVIVPLYAYSKELSPTLVFMKTATADSDPKLIVGAESLEFVTSSAGRVRVTLN